MSNEKPIIDIPESNHDAIAVAAELGRQVAIKALSVQKGGHLDATSFIVLRDEKGAEAVKFLTETTPPPHRKTGTTELRDADSFIEYYKLHGNGAPVYATLNPLQFVAVLNDHTKDAAGFRDFRAVFAASHSPEWTAWQKHNGKGAAFNNNESFALFLEENALDIVQPDAAHMLQIALNFKVNEKVNFSSSQRLSDGNIEFGYSNIVEASASSEKGGKLKIPEVFKIKIPVFAGLFAKKYEVEARFRFRLGEGKMTLWYELIQPRRAEEQAFKDLWDSIKKATGAPILHGLPDAPRR